MTLEQGRTHSIGSIRAFMIAMQLVAAGSWLGCNVTVSSEPETAGIASVTGLAYSDDGELFVSDFAGAVHVIDRDGDVVRTIAIDDARPTTIAVSDPASAMAIGDETGAVHLLSLAGQSIATTSPLEGAITALAVGISLGVPSVAAAHDGGSISVHRFDTGAAVGGLLRGHVGAVTGVAYGPPGSVVEAGLYAVGEDGSLKTFAADASSVSAVSSVVASDSPLGAVAINREGTLLATAGDDAVVRLWTLPELELIRQFSSISTATIIAFSPAGDVLATAGAGTIVRIFSVESGADEPLHVFGKHDHRVSAVAFDPDVDSSAIASGDVAGTVRRWNYITGSTLAKTD